MIYFASFLRAFRCARRMWRLWGLILLPIAFPIAFHGIGAYVSRVPIGLRQRAFVLSSRQAVEVAGSSSVLLACRHPLVQLEVEIRINRRMRTSGHHLRSRKRRFSHQG